MRGRGLKRGTVSANGGSGLSPLMRGRGLKRIQDLETQLGTCVAPHAGAWIETGALVKSKSSAMVAPHAGAWIETVFVALGSTARAVAPHAGAWIETVIGRQQYKEMESPLMRGRGLKQAEELRGQLGERVAPHAGAWIETTCKINKLF